jgi:hypothetical protein
MGAKSVNNPSSAKQLAGFIARFNPPIATLARAARAKLRQRLPGAVEMVYDNSNALDIGYSPTERPSDAVVSIVVYPKCVNLYFIHGAHLPDPDGVLKGDGNQGRHLRLDAGAAMLDTPPLRTLLAEAIAFGEAPFRGKGQVVIRSIMKKQRPRR